MPILKGLCALALLPCLAAAAAPARAQSKPLEIAIPGSMTGIGDFYDIPVIEGARLAVDEANAVPGQPAVAIKLMDDKSSPETAATLAHQVIDGDALVAIGPDLTVVAMRVHDIYATGRLAAIVPTAHGDDIPKAATVFQPIFNTGQLGAALADYLHYVLRKPRGAVIYHNDAFGVPIAEGFRREAEHLGVTATLVPFASDAEGELAAKAVAADPSRAVPVVASVGPDAIPVIKGLRRSGMTGPIFGPDAISDDAFAMLFKDEPEETAHPGFFTDNLYAASPLLLDSADDVVLEFAERFRARYGHNPSWSAIQGYDSTRLAIAAVRHAAAALGPTAGKNALREAVIAYLSSLDSLAHAIPGITGPLWFTPGRGRVQPVRMGRFENRLFESAPLQITPVVNPDRSEIAAGSLLDVGLEQYARFQQVVYTGIYLNELPRLDMAGGTFTADFYLWLRYVPLDNVRGLAEPADLSFPDLVRGSFDPKQPAARLLEDDGTSYGLWHMRGDFKNEFDLRRFPFDAQRLDIRLFNAKAASSRIVYVLDRQSFDQAGGAGGETRAADTASHSAGSDVAATRFPLQSAPGAFRDLTQWRTLGVAEFRDNLVTHSGLGDPKLVGLERIRELSGFGMTIRVQRRLLVTMVKSLLPLGLMTLITFASLFFPHVLVIVKVTVAVTAALSGAVLLTAVNAQLGNVGYTIAVEYVFYVFFGLCLFAILSVLVAERLRVAGHPAMARRTDTISRAMYAMTVVGVIVAAVAAMSVWSE